MKNISKIITNIVRISIISIGFLLIFKQEYKNIGILVLTFLLTFYDKVVERILKIKLDEKLKISLILFIFGAQCLGTVLGFYHRFLWWDTMLHTLSGIIFFLVGQEVIKQLDSSNKLNSKIIIAFGICFSLSTGVIWEIFEFVVDSFLGQNMQVARDGIGREALMDTMVDLISVTVGTLIIVVIKVLKNKIKKGEKNEKSKNI